MAKIELILGDCLEVMKSIPDKSVDLVITSPPYNVGNNNMTDGKYGEKSKDTMNAEEYDKFLRCAIKDMLRVCRYYVFFNIQMLSFNKVILLGILGDFKNRIKEMLIWNKRMVAPAIEGGVMNSKFELIIVFSDYNPHKRKFDYSFFKQGTFNNVIEGNNASQNIYSKQHKATFPEYLPSILVRNFSQENDTILDPFMGTATTGAVCKEQKRNFIGIEISPEYYKIAEQRIRNTQELML